MNIISEQQRLETYRSIPEDIRNLYVSDSFVEYIDNLILLFGITKPYKEVGDIVADTILGFYKIADMPKLFQQKLGVSADVSQRMTSQLIEFLSPVVKREEGASKLQNESKATLIQTFATPSTPVVSADENPESQIAHVTPIRTMQSDITRIHGYGAYRQQEGKVDEDATISSSQEDLLGQK
jgi:hypothetical protein